MGTVARFCYGQKFSFLEKVSITCLSYVKTCHLLIDSFINQLIICLLVLSFIFSLKKFYNLVNYLGCML